MITYFGLDSNNENVERMCILRLPVITVESSINFANNMWLTLPVDKFVFDFTNVKSITPLIMLYLSREIFLFRRSRHSCEFSATGYSHARYAAHMGFFRLFGVPFGKEPGDAEGSTSYLPITILHTQEMKCSATEMFIPYGKYIEDYIVDALVQVLIKDKKSPCYSTVLFCLREIMRNVLEHSEADRLIYCAQYWPSKNRASLAILDTGIGIKRSLETNPNLKYCDDSEAIKSSITPGISSKVNGRRKIRQGDEWANSGWGLAMTSEICKEGGGFFIGSGDTAIEYLNGCVNEYTISLEGTIINLDIDTSDLRRLEEITMSISTKWYNANKSKPSTASTKIMNNSYES